MVAREHRADRSAPTHRVRSLDVLARQYLDAGGQWRVHSVFARACNLVDGGSNLLGIVMADAGNGPATLVLQASKPAAPQNHLLAPGDSASLVGDALQVGPLHFDLAGAMLWTPPPFCRSLPVQEIERRLAKTAALAASAAPAGGLAALLPDTLTLASGRPGAERLPDRDPIVGRARDLVRTLADAIFRQYWPDVHTSARALSGLGPGLTPAGDDLLVGLALGLRAARRSLPEPLAEALSSAVEGRTTDLAAARVRHAVAGHPDERAHQMLRGLVADASANLESALSELLAYGHSSGADTLVGLLIGVGLGLRHG